MNEDYVLFGWKLKNLPDNWAVRNLLNTEPSPPDDWEPVFVKRDGWDELLAYRTMLIELGKAAKNRHGAEDSLDAKLAEVRTFLMGTSSPDA